MTSGLLQGQATKMDIVDQGQVDVAAVVDAGLLRELRYAVNGNIEQIRGPEQSVRRGSGRRGWSGGGLAARRLRDRAWKSFLPIPGRDLERKRTNITATRCRCSPMNSSIYVSEDDVEECFSSVARTDFKGWRPRVRRKG